MRRFLTTLAAVSLIATACGADGPIDAALRDDRVLPGDDVELNDDGEIVIDVGGNEIVLTSALSGFDSCDSLLDHLRTEGAARVGPWGFNDGWYGGFWPQPGVLMEADMALDDSADSAPVTATAQGGSDGQAVSPTEGVDFSGTNVQESGVDEADIVKTDGERIYIVASGELVVVDVGSRSVVGSVAVPSGDRAELFLDGNDLLLINQGWFEGEGFDDEVVPLAVEDDAYYPGTSRTTVTRITIDGDTPRILETLSTNGDYVSARAVDGTARIVIRSNPQHSFPFVYPAGENGEERAQKSNRDALLDSQLNDWLPRYTLGDADGSRTTEGQLVPCEQVHAPTEFAGFGVLSVLTIDVDGSIDPGATTAVLAPGDVVYASPDSIYVATTAWFDVATFDIAPEQIQENITTSIHRFDISSSSSAAYTASGSLEGIVRDSFSFSEHNGHLRVVTTTGNTWDESAESFLRVMRETDGELVEVGSVGDMGNGEAVQSVRFQGDVGYVVTFRQVDPLYTLDLADPENPTVRGELKIPGFSSYLHPIGNGLVIGVGSDADEQNGQVTGSKVSLFDVSDLDNPQEVATWIGPESWNNIGWDTHAFLWWAEKNLAVIPIQTWGNGQQWAGVVVLEIGNNSIHEVGRLDHADATATLGDTECSVITEDDLPDVGSDNVESEFEYMVVFDDGLVLDCEEGESQTASGYDCHTDTWMTEEAERLGVETDGTLLLCWPTGNGMPTISRSMVLPGGELWTVSSPWGWLGGENPARLQVNDLTNLDRIDALNL